MTGYEAPFTATFSDPPSRRYVIRNDCIEAAFQPLAGGRMLSLRHVDHGDILVPLHDADFDQGNWPKAGGFPLFPFHNRIRDAAFRHDGRLIRLRPNSVNGADVIHGPAHRRPWRITEKGRDFVAMKLNYRADPDWPFDFTAAQRFKLDGNSLAIDLCLTNSGSETMPGGIGWHPYFNLPLEALVWTDARTRWNPLGQDGQPEPVSRDTAAEGNAMAIGSTEHYSNWTEVSAWIGGGAKITFFGGAPLSHVVMHRMASYLCMEPASHVSGALGALPESSLETGLCLLGPDESIAGTVMLTINRHDEVG